MADYGHDLLFGTFLTPKADAAEQVVELAELTERVGLDLVTVQDHPYQPAFLDTWTLLSVIAGRTSTVRISPNVANLPLRPPAMLARGAASLDILSGGRVELGLGAGGFWDAIAAMGGPRREPAESVEALDEAIRLIRALWTPGRGLRLDGRHYQLRGAKPGPFPVHPIGIWLGSYKPRMLRLTGRAADGWLPSAPYLPPDQLAAANKIIDDAAASAGRSPDAVRRLYNIIGDFPGGPMKTWPEQLAELTLDKGMSGYILGGDSAHAIEQFAAEVAPAVRDIVATERAGGAPPRPDQPAGAATPPVPAGQLTVTPTPDDGVRRSPVRVWDESTRPTGPAPDPGRPYTRHDQAAGQHLIDVHDHLRGELTQLRDVVEQVAAGTMPAGEARSHLNTMTMRQNNWTLGTFCESYCRVVTIHHTLEDTGFFPYLRRADQRLVPVVDRLEEEHRAIHGVIERVDQALVALVTKPDGIADLRDAIDLLTDTLLSHLSYEERELVEPLARLGWMP
jgi:hypothetical protein